MEKIMVIHVPCREDEKDNELEEEEEEPIPEAAVRPEWHPWSDQG